MSKVLFKIFRGDAGAYLLDCLSNESGHSGGHHVYHGCFLCAVTSQWHTVGIIQSSCSKDHSQCIFDQTKCRADAVW
jgi:hypothetical protein